MALLAFLLFFIFFFLFQYFDFVALLAFLLFLVQSLLLVNNYFPNPKQPTNTFTTFVSRLTHLFQRRRRSNKGICQHRNTAKNNDLGTKRQHGSYHFPPTHHIPSSSSSSVSPLSIPPSSLP